MDVVQIMESLAERGVTILLKADAERMREGVKPWTFVASGAPFGEDLLVRTEAASVKARLEICLPRSRTFGLVIPESGA